MLQVILQHLRVDVSYCFALLLGLHVIACYFGFQVIASLSRLKVVTSMSIDYLLGRNTINTETVDDSSTGIAKKVKLIVRKEQSLASSLKYIPQETGELLSNLLAKIDNAEDAITSQLALNSIHTIFLDEKSKVIKVVEGVIAKHREDIRRWHAPLESESILTMPTIEGGVEDVLLDKDIAKHHLMGLGLLSKPSIGYGNDAMSILGVRNLVFGFLSPEEQQTLLLAEAKHVIDVCPHLPNKHIEDEVKKLEAMIGPLTKAIMLFDKDSKAIIREQCPEASPILDTLAVINRCVERATFIHQELVVVESNQDKNDMVAVQNNFDVTPTKEEDTLSTSEAVALPVSNRTRKLFVLLSSYICNLFANDHHNSHSSPRSYLSLLVRFNAKDTRTCFCYNSFLPV